MKVDDRSILVNALKKCEAAGYVHYIGTIETVDSAEYLMKCDDYLIIGTAFNAGVSVNNGIEYDNDFSLDENIQTLIEECEIELLN